MQSTPSNHASVAMTSSISTKTGASARHSMLTHALRKRWLPLAALLSLVLAVTLVVGASAPPSIPAINLSADPLFAAAGGDKPVIALALSVEFQIGRASCRERVCNGV